MIHHEKQFSVSFPVKYDWLVNFEMMAFKIQNESYVVFFILLKKHIPNNSIAAKKCITVIVFHVNKA